MAVVRSILVLASVIASSTADAQPDTPPVPPGEDEVAPEPDPEPAPAAPTPAELARENAELRETVDALADDVRYLEERVDGLARATGKVTGYLDIGFFSVAGDGTGIRKDIGWTHFPEYMDIPDDWVFMGDPLSTAINARGDPATTGESRAITFDAIGGQSATFLVNALNVGLFAPIGERAVFTAKLDVVPRGRDVSQPDGLFVGDYVDARLAYLEYRVARPWLNLSLFAGKFDSSVGFEYRSQEAPSRIEVTPSLICRYTCGYPIGVKARAQLLSDALTINVAVTNGSHFTEGFPFNNEVDRNDMKTVAGRLSYALDLGGELEVGVSGMFGAQDAQAEDDVYQWLIGADLHYHRHDFVIRGEYVQGRANGATSPGAPRCDLAPCLEFKGAYGLVGYRVTNVVMPYARVDWRDALHRSGASFVYVSQLWRATPGLRLTVNASVTIKVEYTINRELGRTPQFANDVFTSALVVTY
jgi:hypothetical protein